ncbi:hypothetical protein RHSIM_Rhsim02G0054200 [Rhododendron simsii]|uniref:Uncharacterized protein n=1 Tax=Rhododendron simsii TaxID=118357 RepID=A0A834HP53_RHOSS|nr:hypothetical protein RHSIM_Rhsim02G0054200 [Rhododendron simsii]
MAITPELLERLFRIFCHGEGPDAGAKEIYVHLTKKMPNYFCIQVLNLMKQEKTRRVTRLHAIYVLRHMLVSDGGESFSRFNSRTAMELKREVLGWLRHFQDGHAAGILCKIVSFLAAQLLPVGKWPELEGFLTSYIQETEPVALDSTLLNLLDELAQHVPTSYLEAVPKKIGDALLEKLIAITSSDVLFNTYSAEARRHATRVSIVVLRRFPGDNGLLVHLFRGVIDFIFESLASDETFGRQLIEELQSFAMAPEWLQDAVVDDFSMYMLKIIRSPSFSPKTIDSAKTTLLLVAELNPNSCSRIHKLVVSSKIPLPLHSACANNEVERARMLLKAGTMVDALDVNKNTALHYAAQYGSKECAALLLEHGAAITLQNLDGETPIAFARRYGQHEVNAD